MAGNSDDCNLDDQLNPFNVMLDVTVCLNSISCLPDFAIGNAYEVVILDEIGLFQRNFVSDVTMRCLLAVWEKIVNIINFAYNMVMAQEGITENDIAFVMNMCGVSSQDRARVRALCFKKPLLLHPNQFTNGQNTTLFHLMKEFKKRICVKVPDPFVLHVLSIGTAEALTHYFQKLCPKKENRIERAWGALKTTDAWQNRFMADTDKYAKDCNILVTTSILVTRVSLTSHFGGFIALFHNQFFTHRAKQQFSRHV